MGPAVLLCPSSAVQLLGQLSPSKTARQKVYSSPNERVRHLLYAHWRADFFTRSNRFWPNSAATSRTKNVRYSWQVLTVAVGEEVSVEEPVAETTVVEESAVAAQPLKGAANGQDTDSSGSRMQRRRSAPRRVNVAALIPGATFTGKVTTIQSFGAFVDIGAFTNGLIHISRLSKAFVKNVEDVVQVGQEVNVQVIDVDIQAKRIALKLMGEEQQQDGEASARGSDRQGTNVQQGRARRGDSQRRNASAPAVTKLKKGETSTGVVKNIIKSGVFVTLPDGVDGFLPASETNLRGLSMNLEAHFKLGQELTVRLLRTERGRVRLTMKQELDLAKINESLNQDVVGGATNPFEIAFRRNAVISSYLEERQKLQEAAEGKVGAEAEASVKDFSEVEPSSLLPEREMTGLSSDDRTVVSAGVSVLEKADEEEDAQGHLTSQESSEKLTEELQGQSLEPVADEDTNETVDTSAESVDEAEVVKQALIEGVQTAEGETAPVEELAEKSAAISDRVMADIEEVSAGKEAVIEEVIEEAATLAPKTVAPVVNVLVAGAAATNPVVASTEEVLALALDEFAAKEATAGEVGGDMKETVVPTEEGARRSVVAAVEDSVTAVTNELVEQQVAIPDLLSPGKETSAAVEEVVNHVEDVVAAVEEPVAIVEEVVAVVEEELPKLETAVQELVSSAEEVFGKGKAAGDDKLGDVEMAVDGVDSVVPDDKEDLPDQASVKEPVALDKKPDVVVEEEEPVISKEENTDMLLEAEKASLESEAALKGAQKKVEQLQENESSPTSQDPKMNKALEEPMVELLEGSQEIAETDALEVVGVNSQDN